MSVARSKRKSTMMKQKLARTRLHAKNAAKYQPRKAMPWLPFVAPNGQRCRYDHRGMILSGTGLVIREWDQFGVTLS